MDVYVHDLHAGTFVVLLEMVEFGQSRGYYHTLRQAAMDQWPEYVNYDLRLCDRRISWDTEFKDIRRTDVLSYTVRSRAGERYLVCVLS